MITIKRYGNIYPKICDIDNLREAHKCARKDKASYDSVQKVDENLDYYLEDLHKMLLNKEYSVLPSDYREVVINDRGKQRKLHVLAYYPHRIVQWAIMLQLEPILLETFVDHTCASIPKRGIHYAYRKVRKYLEDAEGTRYCYKLDVRHFYPSIDHDVLKKLLRKKIKDNDLLDLLDIIIDSHVEPVGIPIGSYLSQYLGNYYLTYFDHYLKEELHIKYVIRYMDDVVIFGKTSEELHAIKDKVHAYLEDELKLEVKGNWQIFPTDVRGVDFVGYRFFRDFTLLRKGTCKRFKKAMRKIKKQNRITPHSFSQVMSYQGWLKWADAYRLSEKYISPIMPLVEDYRKELMIDMPKKKKVQGSAVQAQPVVIDKDTVYVHTNIRKVKNADGSEIYEYDEMQYPKDEYLMSMSAKILELEDKISNVDTQNNILMMGLSDVFDAVIGGAGK